MNFLSWTDVQAAVALWRVAIKLEREGRFVIHILSLFHSGLEDMERHETDSAFATLWMVIELMIKDWWHHIRSVVRW